MHGLFLVEEDFVRDVDDEDEIGLPARPDSTIDAASVDEETKAKLVNEYAKDERVQAQKDFLYINKYARNCPEHSSMRLMAADKFKFAGPDPPHQPSLEDDNEPPPEDVKASGGKGAKGKAEEAPVEVQKSPEELAEEKMFDDFASEYMEKLAAVKADLTEYRGLVDPETGVKRVALWPKKLSRSEVARMKQEEEERLKREAEEEEKKRLAEEEAAAAAKAPGKKAPPPKVAPGGRS